ncbi:MAG: AI-2E family transporter, partial [Gemmatimonadetes bacterium]|nr:AI-2E family transporter [Gemmatimonadota bacterium]
MARVRYGGLLTAIFAALVLLFLYSVAEILLLLFIAVLFGLYLGAATDSLQRWVGAPRGIALASAVLLTLLGGVGIAYLVVPPVAEQSEELVQALPAQLVRWEAQLLALAAKSPVAAQILGPLREGESYVGTIVQQVGG